MLKKIKLSIRRFHNVLDDDLKSDVDACMFDLQRVGIVANIANADSKDPLIMKAAELYYKWQIDYNEKGEQYQKAYEKLRDALSLCGDYTESVNADV